jgi:hypothetical protein
VSDSGPGDDLIAPRLAELTHREVALRRITEAVEAQRTRLEERERRLQERAPRRGEDERVADAVRRAESAEQRVRELEQRISELEASPRRRAPRTRPAPSGRSEAAAKPDAADPPAQPLASGAAYTLQNLERLLQAARLRGDPRAEEWAYYLPLLRQHAAPDGRLPAQFAALVDGVFEPY